MSGFVIKYQDINDILWEYKDHLEKLIDNITAAQNGVKNFCR